MILKSFKYILPISIGLLLCSCSIPRNKEYENFLQAEKRKIKNEQILLEKQKQINQQEQWNLQKQREQLKKEYLLLYQEKETLKQEKITLLRRKKQLDDEKTQLENEKVKITTQPKRRRDSQEKPKDTNHQEKKNCQWPLNKDGSCMNGWNDIKEVPCKAGYFNILKEGWGGAIGNVSYEEVVNWVCHACSKGHYCPGDGFQYECLTIQKTGATECPQQK